MKRELMDRLRSASTTGAPVRVPELAEVLGCSRSHIYKLIYSDALRVGRVGLDYRIPLSEAQRLARELGVI